MLFYLSLICLDLALKLILISKPDLLSKHQLFIRLP